MKVKGLYSGTLKLLPIVCLLLGDFTLRAQNIPVSQNNIASDSTSIKKQKQGFFNIFKNLFHKKDKNSSSTVVKKNSKNGTDSTSTKNPHKPKPVFELTKGSLTWTSLYTQGVNLNTGISGLYSLGRLSQGFDIYGTPIAGQGTGVFDNGQLERSYSSYSMSFDVQAYQNGLRKRAENVLFNKKTVGKAPNLSDSLNAYDAVREKLQSPSYQSEESANKSQFQKDEESAQKNPGSDTTELHNLRIKMYSYNQLEKRYQQLFTIKRNSNNLEKADSSGRKYEQDEKMLNNPDNVEKILSENHQLSPYEKFLMGVQKFTIGHSGEEISEFTFHSFMMNGINVGYKSDGIYTYVGYGKEVAVVNPLLITGINVPAFNRTVEFARVGDGPEDGSNIYATVIDISDPGSSSSLKETNWIFDLSKQIAVGKNLSFEAEIAKSELSYVPGRFDSAVLQFNPQNNNDLAYALRAKGKLTELGTKIKAEVSQTGADFVTLGNPYLISGATKYEMDIDQPLSKKLDVDVGGTHLLENMGTSDETKETDNWIEFSILYKPTRLINMEFKYSPRQFQQETGPVYANSITNNINLISFTGDISSRIFGKNTTTNIFAGNFQYTTTEVSQLLSQNLNLSYYMVNELFMLSPTQGIDLSVDESRNNWTGSLSQFIGQGTYNWSLKKSLTMGLGPQWVEQPGIMPNEAGLTGSLSSAIQKWGRIGLQFTYRNNIEKPLGSLSQYLVNGNISILW